MWKGESWIAIGADFPGININIYTSTPTGETVTTDVPTDATLINLGGGQGGYLHANDIDY